MRVFRACILLATLGPVFSQTYTISTVTGAVRVIEGALAVNAPLREPNGLVVDSAGSLYIADTPDNRVRKVNSFGTITTIAGTGKPGYSGDRGKAAAAQLSGPYGLAVDSSGTLYIADRDNNRIRKVTLDGNIDTFAGNGQGGFGGDGGPAIKATLTPLALAFDPANNLYFSDLSGHIRKVDAVSGNITTIAGSGGLGFFGDNGPALSAQFNLVTGIAATATAVYVADVLNSEVRKIQNGTIVAVAGTSYGYIADGVNATDAVLLPSSVLVDGTTLYLTDINRDMVRRVDLTSGLIYTAAGNGAHGFGGDNGPPLNAQFNAPGALAIDSARNLYVSDFGNRRVRKVTPILITTYAGTSVGDGLPATQTFLNFPAGIVVDAAGRLVVADSGNQELRAVSPNNFIGRIGNLQGAPLAVAADQNGNVFVTDDEPVVLKIDPVGNTTIVAGTAGAPGYTGDHGPATSATIDDPAGIAADMNGNLFITDGTNNRVRKVDASKTITTIAGNGAFKFFGDGGMATAAGLDPQDVAVDRGGVIYVADQYNDRIRRIAPDGTISTIAGIGTTGYSGDGGPATNAQLNSPSGVTVDNTGNLYIADRGNSVVRRVTPSGLILTIAGKGTLFPATGDGGPALAAQLDPFRIALDSAGSIYIADRVNDHIRKLTLVAQKPATLSVVSGNAQTGITGMPLALPIVVRIADASGAPISGVEVHFLVSSGSATLKTLLAVTVADGTASTAVTLGASAGTVQIGVQVTGLTAISVTETATLPVSPTAPIIAAGGIAGAGLSTPPVTIFSPNGLISIFGDRFTNAGTVQQVSPADLVSGKIPTNFGGVCVLIGNAPAPVLTVTRTQLNVQVPTLAPGTYTVQVSAHCGQPAEEKSNTLDITVQATSPEWFYLQNNGTGHSPIAAINAVTGALIGSPGSIAGLTTVAALPTDYLALFGTGFGITTPAFQAGDLPGAAGQVNASIQISIGGVMLDPTDILYVGVTQNAGLYQVNVRVPGSVPAGDQAVVLTLNGVMTPAGYINVGGQ